MSKPEDTKRIVVAIHDLCPDDPIEAASTIALALAFCAVGQGWSRHVLEDAMDVAFNRATAAAADIGFEP